MSTRSPTGIGLNDLLEAQTNDHGMFKGDMAASYSARTGDCNTLVADHIISLVQPYLPPTHQPLRILDNACGPAVVTTRCFANAAIIDHAALHISAVDISSDFVANNRSLIAQTPVWTSNGTLVDTAVMDGTDLHFAANTFDASFTSLAIFAFQDPVKGTSELRRTLKPGGVAALTMFKGGGWQPLFYEAERIIRPGARMTTFPFLEPWQIPGKLERTLKDGGFEDVAEGEAKVMAWWGGRDEAAKYLADTVKVLVGNAWSESEKELMEENFRRVIDDSGGGVVKGEDGKVGFEMEIWTAVAKKEMLIC